MRCQCPHYTETDNGWCCPEVMRLRDKLAECQEALKREKDKNRHRDRTGTEAEFGASAPSSRRVKANSGDEKRSRRGGAQEGHPPHARKAATEETADEVVRVEMPGGTCPECGGPLQAMGERERTVDDLERPRMRKILYRAERKWCPCCRRTVQARVPGVLPRAGLSNRALATLSETAYADMVPLGTLSRVTGILEGRLLGAMKRLAQLLEPCLPRLREAVCASGVAHADETPWRCDGRNGYAWGFASADTALYAFRATRASEVAVEALGGIRPDATVVTDRYAAYNRLACHRQFCFEHLKRDALDIAREFPRNAECQRFSARASDLMRRAMRLRREAPDPDDFRPKAFVLAAEIMDCMAADARHPAIQRFQAIFRENRDCCFRWTFGPHIPADNNHAERAMRPVAVVRKISGGSQSDDGLLTREVLTSVWRTLRLRHGPDQAHALFVSALDRLAANPSGNVVDSLFPSPFLTPGVNS